jgi:hypothetical protein
MIEEALSVVHLSRLSSLTKGIRLTIEQFRSCILVFLSVSSVCMSSHQHILPNFCSFLGKGVPLLSSVIWVDFLRRSSKRGGVPTSNVFWELSCFGLRLFPLERGKGFTFNCPSGVFSLSFQKFSSGYGSGDYKSCSNMTISCLQVTLTGNGKIV